CERADNETGICWPSMRKIAMDGGIALSTVQEHVSKLENLDILKVNHRGNERLNNRYWVNLTVLAGGTEDDLTVPGGGIATVPGGGTSVPPAERYVPGGGTEPVNKPVTNSVSPKPVTENQGTKEGRKEAPSFAPLTSAVVLPNEKSRPDLDWFFANNEPNA